MDTYNNQTSIKALLQGLANNSPEAKELLLELSYFKIKELTTNYRDQHSSFIHNTALAIQSVTDLSHDVYIKLLKTGADLPTETLSEFYRYLSTMVINTLRDNLKKHLNTQKHRKNKILICDYHEQNINSQQQLDEFISLEKQLDKLESEYHRQAQSLRLKYFLGLSNKEISRLSDCSVRTVENDIKFAKSWLKLKID